jgi:colanic acid/amylovoran biosynthesis glycosyltransferase
LSSGEHLGRIILKIAYFINQYPKVTHTFIRREILALERLGFDVQRIALRGWSETPPDPEDRREQARTRYVLRQGIWGLVLPTLRVAITSPLRVFLTVRLAIRVSQQSDHRHFLHVFRVAEACRILPWLRESGARRLHAHFGTNSAEVAMYVRRLGGPPFSFTVHGPEEFEAPMGLPEKVHEAAFVSAISSYGRAQLYLRCKLTEWPKIHVTHCGLEPSFHQAAPLEGSESRRLVCVGRLCEGKGQLLLVEATARLRAKGIEMDVVLAGDGPLRVEIESAIQRHGLNLIVRITGWISSAEVRAEISAARALVLPSFAEGLPVVIMEAMSLRRPVLSTYVAGIPELVRAGENGWLFPAGSLSELTAAMEDCLSKPAAEVRRMGDAAYHRVIERHSIDVEAAKLAELFRSSTSGASSAAAH